LKTYKPLIINKIRPIITNSGKRSNVIAKELTDKGYCSTKVCITMDLFKAVCLWWIRQIKREKQFAAVFPGYQVNVVFYSYGRLLLQATHV